MLSALYIIPTMKRTSHFKSHVYNSQSPLHRFKTDTHPLFDNFLVEHKGLSNLLFLYLLSKYFCL